jgi:hypothetical protein
MCSARPSFSRLPRRDQFALGRAEGKEGLQLEGAELAQAQVRRLPALHRAPPSVGRSRYAAKKQTAISTESMVYCLSSASLLALRTVTYCTENEWTPIAT